MPGYCQLEHPATSLNPCGPESSNTYCGSLNFIELCDRGIHGDHTIRVSTGIMEKQIKNMECETETSKLRFYKGVQDGMEA